VRGHAEPVPREQLVDQIRTLSRFIVGLPVIVERSDDATEPNLTVRFPPLHLTAVDRKKLLR